MNQFETSNTEAATVITSSLALFGGELLLLCLKRIFAKSDNKTISEVEEELNDISYRDSNMSDIEPIINYSDDGAVG